MHPNVLYYFAHSFWFALPIYFSVIPYKFLHLIIGKNELNTRTKLSLEQIGSTGFTNGNARSTLNFQHSLLLLLSYTPYTYSSPLCTIDKPNK